MKKLFGLLFTGVLFFSCMTETPTYTVVFKSGGGSGSGTMPSDYFTPSMKYTIPQNAFTNTEYVYFAGWDSNDDGIEDYANNESVLLGDSKTTVILTAIWKSCFELAFDANNGDGSMSKQYYAPNEEKNIAANIFTQGGYEFRGWSKTDSPLSLDYIDEESISLERDTTLYAVWSELK